MLPPFPLLLVCWAYCHLTKAALIADAHSGAFNDKKWQWTTRWVLRLLQGHILIVTNKDIAPSAFEEGSKTHAVVLHDALASRPATAQRNDVRERVQKSVRPRYVLFPASYASDEPISNVIAAATLCPELKWVLTGNPKSDIGSACPPNVEFTGFLQENEYDKALDEASVVLALTNRDATMQRAGYEALLAGRPLVASDTSVLKEFHGSSALYTDNTPEDIRDKVRMAVENQFTLEQNSRVILRERYQQQVAVVESLSQLMSERQRQSREAPRG
ncbi:glycosyltransferase [Rhodococcus fascians]|uniref:glycosyltransferase n=1 Tax=Rhodococcoides fascians TaxID=1828 RepID=UPI00195E9EFD|nr:glycosyltransferase [Rhodococcus fascians]MBM7241658.1 glycosyltransferase [Rhodococcus fascians]MBY3808362.1 glycosyltransferase [Rhodococcus fascians]MBY3839806.1 glycosyltransferase [Rhodococcus fascians]MBY3846669.1 glycosyltransferase [Rhodococcus fascians]MBY3848993.1 glycosyltransferase [Rhodococcus fascians]